MTLLKGTVVDQNGHPVPDASVYFVSAPVAVRDVAVLTNADGSFTLTAPAVGEYRVGARAGGFRPGEISVAVHDSNEMDVRITLQKE